MSSNQYLIFEIECHCFAVPIDAVLETIRSVRLSPLPDGPALLQGLLNIGGDIIPAVNIRKQLGLPERALSVSDRIIIVRVAGYDVAFVADRIEGVSALEPGTVNPAEAVYPDMEHYISSVSHYNGQSVLIYQVEKLIPENTLETITDHLQAADRS
ncbi:MAG: chemotaxis protein CheW [Thermodesulfobacteriota bacterium]